MEKTIHTSDLSENVGEEWHSFQTEKTAKSVHHSKYFEIHLTSLLRLMGALALVASAAAYMLSGFAELDLAIRHWGFLLIIVLLTASGLLSKNVFTDIKSARLLFALCALVVPTQTTHIAAMLHGITQGKFPNDPFLFIVSAALSLSIGGVAAYLGLAILARPHAKKLCGLFLLFNAFLLIPYRDSVSTLIICLISAYLYWQLNTNIFNKISRYHSLEGYATQLLIASPIIIYITRYLFYSNTSAAYGFATFAACLFAKSFLIRHWHSSPRPYCLLGVFGLLFTSLGMFIGSLLFTVLIANGLSGNMQTLAIITPLTAIAIYFAKETKSYKLYNGIAGLLISLLALSLLDSSFFEVITSILILTVFAAFGLCLKSKILLIVPTVLIAIFGLKTITFLMSDLSVHSWIGLATCGLIFVLLSSLIEKHGKTASKNLHDMAAAINNWHY